MSSCVLRNTLLSARSVETVVGLPLNAEVNTSLFNLLTKFQDIKKFASEIHTEIHLVKPALKNLGYVYESKPKFFEEQIKNPDVALFTSEEERVKSSQLWGTKEYYSSILGMVVLKRYGRNLHEGIGGFYLEFENKMPLYQMLYLLKKSRTPWGLLTNGKHWILMRRPVQFEMRMIEIDLEKAVFEEDLEAINLFCQVFSCTGLKKTLPQVLEEERTCLIQELTEKKRLFQDKLKGQRRKVDFYPVAMAMYRSFFENWRLPTTEGYLREKNLEVTEGGPASPCAANRHDHADIFSYVFSKAGGDASPNLEHLFFSDRSGRFTKEDLFSLKILDITPGFGNFTAGLVDAIAYISFILPYRERNTFRAEWEEEKSLKKHIIDTMLYGIERSHVSFDILQNTVASRFGTPARNFRLGNPLIGMPLKNIAAIVDSSNQMALFNKHPKEMIAEFKELYALFFSLSDKIKEDMEVRLATEMRLQVFTERIRDLMDVMTATYFTKTVENRRIEDMIFSLDGNEAAWSAIKSQDWFRESKEIAKRNGFFHFEIEFPFLLSNAFDFIFVQPALSYAWEEELPLAEATKAFVKRAMPYLKQEGKLIILTPHSIEQLVPDLKRSKRYEVEAGESLCILKKKI